MKLIEQVIYDYLKSVSGVPVYLEHAPGTNGTRRIVIEKTGGGEYGALKNATFAVQSYGLTIVAAAELNNHVKNWMKKAPQTLEEICDVDLNSDYNFTDTESKEYRYQAVFDLVYYPDEEEE
jgi:hypothetical protein